MRRYQINSVNFFNYKNSKKNLIATAVTIVVLFVVVLPALLLGGEAMALNTGLDDTAKAAQLPLTENIAQVIGQIIYAILGFLGIIFILLLIYGGFLRMTAQGDPGKIKTSYGIITSAVIGVVIILASYTITAFIIGQVEGSGGNGEGGGGGDSGYKCCVNVNLLNPCQPANADGTCPNASTGYARDCSLVEGCSI